MSPTATRLLSCCALAALFLPVALRLLAGEGEAPPAWAAVPPGIRLAILLLAPACLFAAGGDSRYGRVLAAAALLLALLMLLATGVAEWRGLPRSGSLMDSLRPTALTALGIAALALSLLWRGLGPPALDFSAIPGVLACALFFLLVLAHLFGATALTGEAGAPQAVSTTLGASLLLALALAGLGAHEDGPLRAYRGEGTGAVALRRLLPAAVLTPISAGLLVLVAIGERGLSPALAVALATFSNVVVMLVLIHSAGSRVSAVAQAREKTWQRKGARDALTGLLNRGGWDQAVQLAAQRCSAEGIEACVLMMDLDGLKRVNDSEGHAAGDALIQAAGEALQAAARRGDTLARIGGDEFAYLALDCDAAMSANIATRFEQSLAAAGVDASVGYALTRDGALDVALESADRAMYQRKRARRLRRA